MSIESVIEGSIAAASDEGIVSDGGADPVDVVTEPVVEGADPVVEPVAETDEVAKYLESEGIKAQVEGKRENRIPYSRVTAMIKKREQKILDAHKAELEKTSTPFNPMVEAAKRAGIEPSVYAQNLLAMERLAQTDPDRYIQVLAAVSPAFKKFIREHPEGAVTKPAVADTDPKPAPDAKYADGSVGYSAEGFEKVLQWQQRQTEKVVTERLEKQIAERFGPMEQRYKSEQEQAKLAPIVQGRIDEAYRVWGKDNINANAAAINKLLADNDGQMGRPFMDFPTAVQQIMVPTLQPNRERMRAELLAEINKTSAGRAAAATRAVPAMKSGADDPAVPRSMEDLIRDSLRAAGI